MKYTSLILACSLGISALTPVSNAADRDRNRDNRDEVAPNLGESVRHLRDHFERVRAEADRARADKRARGDLSDIHRDIDRVSEEVDSRHFDPERVRGRIARLHEALKGLSAQIGGGDRRGGITIQVR